MLKTITTSLLLAILAAACATGDSGNNVPTEVASSTADFAVTITQTNEPVLIGDVRSTDLRYSIEVANNTSAPVTLKRIALSSVGVGPYQIANTVRQFDRTIAAGTTEAFDFWAQAQVSDYTQGARLPVVLRANLTTNDGAKDRMTSFTQRVAAVYTPGLAR